MNKQKIQKIVDEFNKDGYFQLPGMGYCELVAEQLGAIERGRKTISHSGAGAFTEFERVYLLPDKSLLYFEEIFDDIRVRVDRVTIDDPMYESLSGIIGKVTQNSCDFLIHKF